MGALKCEKKYKYTQKEIRFCDAIVYKEMSQYDAYHYAQYKTNNVKRETIDANASRLANKPKIVARVTELRDKIQEKKLDKAVWTFEDSVRALSEAYRKADEGGNTSGVVNAIKELNNMYGFNRQNINMNADVKVEKIEDYLKEIEGGEM